MALSEFYGLSPLGPGILDPLCLFSSLYDHRNNNKGTFKLDINEKEDDYELTVEVPGVRHDDIKVKVKDNVLTIEAEKKEEKQSGKYYRERSYGKFTRKLALPKGTSGDNIDATYKHGVLTLSIPKVEASDEQQVSIKYEE